MNLIVRFLQFFQSDTKHVKVSSHKSVFMKWPVSSALSLSQITSRWMQECCFPGVNNSRFVSSSENYFTNQFTFGNSAQNSASLSLAVSQQTLLRSAAPPVCFGCVVKPLVSFISHCTDSLWFGMFVKKGD